MKSQVVKSSMVCGSIVQGRGGNGEILKCEDEEKRRWGDEEIRWNEIIVYPLEKEAGGIERIQ